MLENYVDDYAKYLMESTHTTPHNILMPEFYLNKFNGDVCVFLGRVAVYNPSGVYSLCYLLLTGADNLILVNPSHLTNYYFENLDASNEFISNVTRFGYNVPDTFNLYYDKLFSFEGVAGSFLCEKVIPMYISRDSIEYCILGINYFSVNNYRYGGVELELKPYTIVAPLKFVVSNLDIKDKLPSWIFYHRDSTFEDLDFSLGKYKILPPYITQDQYTEIYKEYQNRGL